MGGLPTATSIGGGAENALDPATSRFRRAGTADLVTAFAVGAGALVMVAAYRASLLSTRSGIMIGFLSWAVVILAASRLSTRLVKKNWVDPPPSLNARYPWPYPDQILVPLFVMANFPAILSFAGRSAMVGLPGLTEAMIILLIIGVLNVALVLLPADIGDRWLALVLAAIMMICPAGILLLSIKGDFALGYTILGSVIGGVFGLRGLARIARSG